MMIENLVRICSGELMQKPLVSALTDFTADVSKITRGSAYFALEADKNDINEAVACGAYAIIYSQDLHLKDAEIAYIKVDSVQKAMLKLMRYEIERKEIKVILSSLLQFDMINSFKLQFESHLELESAKDFFALIFEMEIESYLFLKDRSIAEQIAPKFKEISEKCYATILQSHTLFRSSFVCTDVMFREFALTPIFIPEFSAIIEFLTKNNLPYKVESMEKCGHFEPHFVNLAMRKRPFGSTHQAIIIESDATLFEQEALWLEKKMLGKDLIILAPYNAKINIKCKRYSSTQILKTINPSSFRYILMLGNKNDIIEVLETPKTPNPTLF